MKIEIVQGNLVRQPDVEAVVNSANANLRLGSGVAGAIHTAAGPRLEEYCRPFAPLDLGAYLVTPGFQLPNLWVIHVRAAGYNSHDDAPAILHQALLAMLRGADYHQIRSLAFPAIGTGVFAFPPALAARITADALAQADDLAPHLQLVRLCVASADMEVVYRSACAAAGLLVTESRALRPPAHSPARVRTGLTP